MNEYYSLQLYNEKFKLSVEYHDREHYEYIPFCHGNRGVLASMQHLDKVKRNLCEDADVQLIVVPYTTKLNDIGDYLRSRLPKVV